ncbi:hypothetical protein QBC34DRAFT_180445 [Podospora aff. communis PSN243]|uniref:Uncharacterized protein n=1 Tax=Podospora aff. communis PSN243 TaxID=3040156 RepID=A0AAV9GBS6_9PEZI|nr:hypothetical protein QBC34DRAFT_180445 [Podospora aff. communis PSN243]
MRNLFPQLHPTLDTMDFDQAAHSNENPVNEQVIGDHDPREFYAKHCASGSEGQAPGFEALAQRFKNFSSVSQDAAKLSSPPARWQLGHKHSNQFIPLNFNPEREVFHKDAMLLIKPRDDTPPLFVEVPSVFASPDYGASFIFAETLIEFGLEFILADVKKVHNPRGGRFQPIGMTTLYMKFANEDDPFFFNALVLGGSPSDVGAMVILGRPDIHHTRRAN